MLVDWPKPHETMIPLCRGRREDILGRPEYQLGTPPITSDTEIAKVSLELGDIIRRGLKGILLPEINV